MGQRSTINGLLLGIVVAVSTLTVGCGATTATGTSGQASTTASRTTVASRTSTTDPVVPGDPLSQVSFYIPASPAVAEDAQLRAAGALSDARALAHLAAEPTATWITGPAGIATARTLIARASAAKRSALLVAYDIPDRDCGGFSAGGASSSTAYRAWIGALAATIGSHTATVIIEPDAIPQMFDSTCLPASMQSERLSLLRFAVDTLRAKPNVTAYLDAGNPGWIKPASRLVAPLRAAGIARASGFSLNVSNFYATDDVLAYGRTLSAALGGAHYVIDTGRNGNGPAPASASGPGPSWCNPPGRALGTNPTTHTGQPDVDAFLWIKPPGSSDGACRSGNPPAGHWMGQYALELALAAPNQPSS